MTLAKCNANVSGSLPSHWRFAIRRIDFRRPGFVCRGLYARRTTLYWAKRRAHQGIGSTHTALTEGKRGYVLCRGLVGARRWFLDTSEEARSLGRLLPCQRSLLRDSDLAGE
jgi:hypothetical protein